MSSAENGADAPLQAEWARQSRRKRQTIAKRRADDAALAAGPPIEVGSDPLPPLTSAKAVRELKRRHRRTRAVQQQVAARQVANATMRARRHAFDRRGAPPPNLAAVCALALPSGDSGTGVYVLVGSQHCLLTSSAFLAGATDAGTLAARFEHTTGRFLAAGGQGGGGGEAGPGGEPASAQPRHAAVRASLDAKRLLVCCPRLGFSLGALGADSVKRLRAAGVNPVPLLPLELQGDAGGQGRGRGQGQGGDGGGLGSAATTASTKLWHSDGAFDALCAELRDAKAAERAARAAADGQRAALLRLEVSRREAAWVADVAGGAAAARVAEEAAREAGWVEGHLLLQQQLRERERGLVAEHAQLERHAKLEGRSLGDLQVEHARAGQRRLAERQLQLEVQIHAARVAERRAREGAAKRAELLAQLRAELRRRSFAASERAVAFGVGRAERARAAADAVRSDCVSEEERAVREWLSRAAVDAAGQRKRVKAAAAALARARTGDPRRDEAARRHGRYGADGEADALLCYYGAATGAMQQMRNTLAAHPAAPPLGMLGAEPPKAGGGAHHCCGGAVWVERPRANPDAPALAPLLWGVAGADPPPAGPPPPLLAGGAGSSNSAGHDAGGGAGLSLGRRSVVSVSDVAAEVSAAMRRAADGPLPPELAARHVTVQDTPQWREQHVGFVQLAQWAADDNVAALRAAAAAEGVRAAGGAAAARNARGESVLYHAAAAGALRCMQLLLQEEEEEEEEEKEKEEERKEEEHGEERGGALLPKATAHDGETPAHAAAYHGQAAALELLRAAGRHDLWAANARGNTPAHQAALRAQGGALSLLALVDPAAMAAARNEAGDTALGVLLRLAGDQPDHHSLHYQCFEAVTGALRDRGGAAGAALASAALADAATREGHPDAYEAQQREEVERVRRLHLRQSLHATTPPPPSASASAAAVAARAQQPVVQQWRTGGAGAAESSQRRRDRAAAAAAAAEAEAAVEAVAAAEAREAACDAAAAAAAAAVAAMAGATVAAAVAADAAVAATDVALGRFKRSTLQQQQQQQQQQAQRAAVWKCPVCLTSCTPKPVRCPNCGTAAAADSAAAWHRADPLLPAMRVGSSAAAKARRTSVHQIMALREAAVAQHAVQPALRTMVVEAEAAKEEEDRKKRRRRRRKNKRRS